MWYPCQYRTRSSVLRAVYGTTRTGGIAIRDCRRRRVASTRTRPGSTVRASVPGVCSRAHRPVA
eukprot:2218236-Rhodomonas_salina.1